MGFPVTSLSLLPLVASYAAWWLRLQATLEMTVNWVGDSGTGMDPAVSLKQIGHMTYREVLKT